MRAAAALLASTESVRDVEAVVAATGLAGEAFPLDPAAVESLGLDGVREAHLAAGAGLLRVLIARVAPENDLRVWLARSARTLSTRAPHVLWLVSALGSRNGEDTAGIVGWSSTAHGVRVVSLMWSRSRVFDSDAETLCALAAVRGDDDARVYERVLEVLGRESLTRRFYRVLTAQIERLAAEVAAPSQDARDVALLYVSRLVFLAFLEAKGWLDGDRGFVSARFDACMRAGGHFHQRVLLPLFFGTLNTPVSRRAPAARALGRLPFLNGGLFARTPIEARAGLGDHGGRGRRGRSRFSDETLGALLQELFSRFRFVAREDSATWSDASVDPEMLGRAFESLMAEDERKAGGVFYTPHALVARVTDEALLAFGRADPRHLRDARILDPACGSGAFLVHVLERIADLRRETGEATGIAELRRDVLARSIFGVDRSATAVWLCELRLWLSVVIESAVTDPLEAPPLPNLDRNIRVGDALSGPAFGGDGFIAVGGARITALRGRYVRATGHRKVNLSRRLDREERRRVVAELERGIVAVSHARRELLASLRARDLFGRRRRPSPDDRRESRALRDRLRAMRRDLARVRDGGALPFSFAAYFAETQNAGGFDVVLGNPPWVRLHHIPAALRVRLRREFSVFRAAAWRSGAEQARAASGFAGQVDLAALFVERSLRLLRPGGVLSLLLPAKLWRSLAGGGVRRLLLEQATLVRLEDLSQTRHAFDAAVYPSLLVARAAVDDSAPVTLAASVGGVAREWRQPPGRVAYDASPGAPWLTLPPPARAAFDRLRAAGAPLALSHFGAPRLGVKSGCNVAFLVRVTDTTERFARVVDADHETGSVEHALLRPVLRGESIDAWERPPTREWIIWTHDERGAPLRRLPERARAWLGRRYGQLACRADGRGRRWWSLFRTEAADSASPRVVWADFGRRPRALVLPAGDPAVPLNTCYVLRARDECDAFALAVLLNSPLSAAWLNALAEPARGGYRRYLGWTIGQLPIPRDWERVRAALAAAARGTDADLLEATLCAYGIELPDVADLLDAT